MRVVFLSVHLFVTGFEKHVDIDMFGLVKLSSCFDHTKGEV